MTLLRRLRRPYGLRDAERGNHSQGIGTLHLLNKGAERFSPQAGFGGCKVDQIAVVGQHRLDRALFLRIPKQSTVVVREQLCLPLVAALEKNLNGPAPQARAPFKSHMHAPGDGHVGACQ